MYYECMGILIMDIKKSGLALDNIREKRKTVIKTKLPVKNLQSK